MISKLYLFIYLLFSEKLFSASLIMFTDTVYAIKMIKQHSKKINKKCINTER